MRKVVFIFSVFLLLCACSNGATNGDISSEADIYLSLREIDVVDDGLNVDISGEVKTSEDLFYYKVEIGNETIVAEQLYGLESNDDEWRVFQIQLTLKEEYIISEDIPFMTIYAKDGDEVINPNYVPIDIKDS